MMPVPPSPDQLRQRQLVHALSAHGCFPGRSRLPRRCKVEETHISWVLLAGCDAYKIKKSLDLGFLDFSTLEARHFYCTEELRLNRRLAPDLYLDVVAIGGSPEQPVLGGEPAIEYAVHMRRFPRSAMMDSLLADGQITTAHIDKLAATIARFHAALPPAAANSPFGSAAAIQGAVLENFAQLAPSLEASADLAMLEQVRKASAREFTACEPLFRQRKADGCVRECHGDLHLGNIVLLDDTPVPFDGIEFSATLRWIDVTSEIAFTVMDLMQRGQPQLAWRFLNTYLEGSGDYAGISVLRFYLAYRAMVRAKVAAIRANQEDAAQAQQELAACRSYLALAHDCLTRRRPALIITHGLPGCGKSTFAQIALERLGAIRVRSDVERKRLFGLDALADSRSQTGTGIYGEEATRRTYTRLHELARGLLAAGFPVIVDAAFLRHAERENFRALAREMGAPFIIASLRTDEAVLAERLAQRSSRRDDASEADASVLRTLQAAQEPLQEEELAAAVTFTNNGDTDALRAAGKSWALLDARLA
ncbi:MAG: bifunctional aminoglycoside phosphotransferase/ATP-binding protein [Gallionellaceae bacterium]